MAYTVTIRGKLKGDQKSMQAIHDQVTGATKEMARAAGDLTHRVFLNPQDPSDFLGIDEWQSPEQMQAFASNPQIQEFFGQLFSAPPEVTLWADSGWNQW